jgi:hypothetical protein
MNCVTHTVNLVIEAGGTLDKDFRWKYADVYSHIHGFTGTFIGKKKYTSEENLFSLVSINTPWVADGESGIYILDDNSDPNLFGKYKLYMKDDLTKTLCESRKTIIGVYDVFLLNDLGESVLRQTGTLTINVSAI